MPEKRKKTDVAIIVAIIGLAGTLITALFTSPVLIALLERKTPVPTPNSQTSSTDVNKVLAFSSDFESGSLDDFTFDGGNWKIVKDKNNNALEGTADKSMPDVWPMAIFGPSDLGNGVVELKLKFKQLQSDISSSLMFRYNSDASYSITMTQNSVEMGYRDRATGWEFVPFSDSTSRPFDPKPNEWYTMRLEMDGSQAAFFINNNRIFSASDDRLPSGGLNFSIGPGYQIELDDVYVWETK